MSFPRLTELLQNGRRHLLVFFLLSLLIAACSEEDIESLALRTGATGGGATTPPPVDPGGMLSAYGGNAFVIKPDGSLWGWGGNTVYGTLGTGGTGAQPTPAQIGVGNAWTYVSVGNHHTVAVKTDGSLWGWGRHDFSQLSNLVAFGNKLSPVQIGTAFDWDNATSGSNQTLAIKTDGSLWVWGYTGIGQVGNGVSTTTGVGTPYSHGCCWVEATATNTSMVLNADGTMWTWGRNSRSNLGIPGYLSWTETCSGEGYAIKCAAIPLQITGMTWKDIGDSNVNVAAIASDGSLWTWGHNESGQLGYITTDICTIAVFSAAPNVQYCGYQPQQVGADTDWIDVATSVGATVAVKADGTLWSFGGANFGALGRTPTDTCTAHNTGAFTPHPCSPTPGQIGADRDWVKVAGGGSFFLAMKADGSVWSWGRNDSGQLGRTTSDTCTINSIAYDCGLVPQPVAF